MRLPILSVLCVVALAETPNRITVFQGTVPLEQISGSVQQIQSNGIYATVPAIADFVSLYGNGGSDECVMVPLPDGSTFMACGDTLWTYCSSGGMDTIYQPWFQDSMAIIPANNWSKCHAIEGLDQQMQAGNHNPVPDYTGCAAPVYFSNPSHTSTQPIGQMLGVSGLSGNEDTLAFHIPVGGWLSSDGYIYLLYAVHHQEPNLNFDTVVVKSSTAYPFNTKTQLTFNKLYQLSGHAAVPTAQVQVIQGSTQVVWVSGATFDNSWLRPGQWEGISLNLGGAWPTYQIASIQDAQHLTLTQPYTEGTGISTMNMLPKFATNTGKFVYAGAITATSSQVASRRWSPYLPSALQGKNIVCLTGANYAYRRSNLYAGCADSSQVDTGTSAWWYVVGFQGNIPLWQKDTAGEAAAVALLPTWNHGGSISGPCIGELDSKWYDSLGAVVLTYGSYYECGGMYMRTAPTPWGPYSGEQQFFDANPNSGWGGKLIHGYGSTNQVTANLPVISVNGASQFDFNANGWGVGGVYGPYQMGQALDNGDGTVSIVHMFSSFRPYVATLGKFTVSRKGTVSFNGNVVLNGTIKVH